MKLLIYFIWMSLVGIVPLTHAETYLAGQPEYIPLIEGTHLDACSPDTDRSGRFVSFTTSYPLLPEHGKVLNYDRYHNTMVYGYDREEQTLELLSVTPEGEALKYGYCHRAQCSDDGRYVCFNSISFEFVPFPYDLRYGEQIYLRDRINQINYHVSKSIDGNPAPKNCLLSDINADGRFVLFTSRAVNLTERTPNGTNHLYLYDRQDDSIQCVSTTREDIYLNSDSDGACFSSDARFIAFYTYATNCLAKIPAPDVDPLTPKQVVLKDRENGEITILTTDWNGQQGTGKTQGEIQISDDGRWIAFLYNQPLLPDLPQAWVYVYLYDREEQHLESIASLTPKYDHFSDDNVYNLLHYKIVLSGDGQTLFWYQGLKEYDNVDVYRYARANRTIQRIVYSSEVPWQGPDVGEFWYSPEGCCTNYNGSLFLFVTGSKELTPLYNQGTYQSPFPFQLYPSYRLLMVNLENFSQSAFWNWMR